MSALEKDRPISKGAKVKASVSDRSLCHVGLRHTKRGPLEQGTCRYSVPRLGVARLATRCAMPSRKLLWPAALAPARRVRSDEMLRDIASAPARCVEERKSRSGEKDPAKGGSGREQDEGEVWGAENEVCVLPV
eukprot:6197265-Pleurochrysis_carterae.AAC.5